VCPASYLDGVERAKRPNEAMIPRSAETADESTSDEYVFHNMQHPTANQSLPNDDTLLAGLYQNSDDGPNATTSLDPRTNSRHDLAGKGVRMVRRRLGQG
jgi:hypothetical protein